MTRRTFVTTFAVLGAAIQPVLPAQRKAMPRYDLSTEATFQGTVEEVREVEHAGFQGKGLHVTLKTAAETFDVHVGPASFVKEKNLTLAKGDQVTITGSKVKEDGGSAVIARSVQKGATTVTLRDDRGRPLWSGGRRRGR
jgi:DNA/RNA endonuclease YhcR with UshA esterase domain